MVDSLPSFSIDRGYLFSYLVFLMYNQVYIKEKNHRESNLEYWVAILHRVPLRLCDLQKHLSICFLLGFLCGMELKMWMDIICNKKVIVLVVK